MQYVEFVSDVEVKAIGRTYHQVLRSYDRTAVCNKVADTKGIAWLRKVTKIVKVTPTGIFRWITIAVNNTVNLSVYPGISVYFGSTASIQYLVSI